jgi:circadian clock protein KaiC
MGREQTPQVIQKLPTCIAGLDEVMAGGLPGGGITVVLGGAGSGKTTFGLQVLAHVARAAQEPGILVAFEESAERILANSSGFEWGGEALHNSPVHVLDAQLSQSVEQGGEFDLVGFLAMLGAQAKQVGARQVVFDGIDVLLSYLDNAAGNTLPLIEHTPFKVSTIADTWMHVSYESRGGERNRALTVIKSRGTAHSNQVRELTISESGISLTDVYSVGGEVLMGTLRWERENDARRARATAQSSAVVRERKAELALAATTAHLETLGRERAIQEAELELMRTDAALELGYLTQQDDEMLNRRRADRSTPPLARSAANLPGGLRP